MHRIPLWLAIFILLFQLVLAIGGSINGADVGALWGTIIVNIIFIIVAIINARYWRYEQNRYKQISNTYQITIFDRDDYKIDHPDSN